MNQYYLKGSNGKYFVLGQGFTALTKCTASKLTGCQVTKANETGFYGAAELIVVVKSYAVNYVRKDDITGGKVSANTNNPSSHRFATFDEAFKHGTNLGLREESKAHVGFYITESTDSVNAEINWKSGLTNSK